MQQKLILLTFIIFSNLTYAISPMEGYQSSNVKDEELLDKVFKKLNRNKKRFGTTQCFNRAHYWSYQMQQDFGIDSQKVFIYFTKKYIREINGSWWFHVAPAFNFSGELYVFDPEFLKSAVPFEAWKNGAIDHAIKRLTPIKLSYEKEIASLSEELETLGTTWRQRKRRNYIVNRLKWLRGELKRRLIDKARVVKTSPQNWPYDDRREEIIELECPFITNYSEYKEAQETAYCYIQMASMYVWEPGELEKLEFQEKNKDEFNMSEIYTAFKDTFRGRFPYPFK